MLIKLLGSEVALINKLVCLDLYLRPCIASEELQHRRVQFVDDYVDHVGLFKGGITGKSAYNVNCCAT